MKKFISFLFVHYNQIITVILFLITAFIILLIIPHQTRFKFEYQKGKPWMYETLVASFDFPVLKNKLDIEKEKDSIIKNSPLYFYKDEQVLKNILKIFKEDFNKINFPDTSSKTLTFQYYNNFLINLLNKPGIIETNDSIANKYKNVIVFIQTDSTIEEHFIYNIKTVNEAKQAFVNELKQNNPDILIKLARINDYFNPNLFFNKNLTRQVIEQLLSEISINKGLIQRGETIISKGEIITIEKFLILESLQKEFVRTSYNPYLLVGQFLTISLGLLMIFLFLYHFRREILLHFTKTSFILSLIVLFIFLAQKVFQIDSKSIYIVPFTLLPIIIRSFYDSRLALFIHTITILIISYFLPNSFEFMFTQYIAGITAVFVLVNVRRRAQLFLAAIFIFITYSIIYFGISIIQTESIQQIEWRNLTWFGINALIVLSAYPLIYIFEKLFGFISDVTLLELSDTNHSLLRLLAEKAPGTFQHSLQVASLSEEIIQKIGGNPLLARVGALYHDIGKLELPQYFIENQHQIQNPHKNLQVDKSIEIISGHVNYGVKLAKKYKLPKSIIEFIESHHGDSIMQYFYKTYTLEHPSESVNKDLFRYKGNKPSSKETAVVMIADSVEAASKSLKNFNDENIQKMIDSVIEQKFDQQQFDFAPITLKEISIIKDILKKRLRNIYHSRISYPTDIIT